MLLKRLYSDQPNADGTFAVTGVEVKHTGLSATQNFSRRLVLQAMDDGWLKISGQTLTIKGQNETLQYAVLREPGYYCKSTGERIPISAIAWEQAVSQPAAIHASAEARAWLEQNGKAAGDYEVTMAYECELDADQHARLRALRDIAGNPVAAHTVEG